MKPIKPINPIELLVCAIATQENNPETNPGNLRFAHQQNASRPDGSTTGNLEDEPIAQFSSRQAGIVALWRDVLAKAAEDHTVLSLIQQYAPPNENNTAAYCSDVLSWTALPAGAPVMSLIPEPMKLN